MAAAYSHELPKYGMPAGLTNYAAGTNIVRKFISLYSAYATGLLLARRVLAKLGLADKYKGNTNVNGEDYNVEEIQDGPRPFRAVLDVGLHRTTTGSKIFAALKGATDGGIDVPHSETRFVGYSKADKGGLKADVLRKHIFGGHVADYMKSMREENNPKFVKHFSQYLKANIKPEELESKWAAVHKSIRADPTFKKVTKTKPAVQKRFNRAKLNAAQRANRVKQLLANASKKAQQ